MECRGKSFKTLLIMKMNLLLHTKDDLSSGELDHSTKHTLPTVPTQTGINWKHYPCTRNPVKEKKY